MTVPRIVIPEGRIWVTPSGITHIEYVECAMCHTRKINIDDPDSGACSGIYPDDFPHWHTPYRPSVSDLMHGHYYQEMLFTLGTDNIPEGLDIPMPKKHIEKVQMRLF